MYKNYSLAEVVYSTQWYKNVTLIKLSLNEYFDRWLESTDDSIRVKSTIVSWFVMHVQSNATDFHFS